ncbi:MAG: hypothetical protein JNM84_00105 [Planctomycetes bacterium]|nr:hypothetical protein [Planctomycetota bacterium]
MSDPKTAPPDAEALARDQALLSHRATSIYVLRDELLRFADNGASLIVRLPLSDLERVDPPRPRNLPSLLALAIGLSPLALLQLPAIAESGLYVWLLLIVSVIALCIASAQRHASLLPLRTGGKQLYLPLAGDRRGAHAFALSFSLLLRDLRDQRLEERAELRPPAKDLDWEPKKKPDLRDATARIRVLGPELVFLDEHEHFAARFPLADIREVRCARRYDSGLLFLAIAAGLVCASQLSLAHSVAQWTWVFFAFCFGFAAVVGWPWWKVAVVLELREARAEHLLQRSRTEADAFVQSLGSRQARSA